MANNFFKIIESKNCRKYLKRCYELSILIDKSLIEVLDEWNCVEIIEFSKFSPLSKDTFKIHLEDYFMINGILNDNLIYLIVPPQQIEWIEIFENKLKNWIEIKNK